MVDAKKGIVARALRSREFVERADGGAATARRGVVYMLKHGITVMLKAINTRLAAAGLTPIHRDTLSALVAGKEYTQLKPDLCCCAACRDLGSSPLPSSAWLPGRSGIRTTSSSAQSTTG